MNPVLVHVTRGGIVESMHRGAYCVFDNSNLILSDGDIEKSIYPRSSIKIIQALALLESGAADSLDLTDEEIALTCASHNGEPIHVKVANQILSKVGLDNKALQCGIHWPMNEEITISLAKTGEDPCTLHNNCSGKHAGFLAYMRHHNIALDGYTNVSHPMQIYIREALEDVCDVDLKTAPFGIDGCAIPTWALPLKNLAFGFSKLSSPEKYFSLKRSEAIKKITQSVFNHPYMVAGKDRYDSLLMQAFPNRVFVKVGAEGVFCAFVPDKGIGIAIKCDDGSVRGAESILSGLLNKLNIISEFEFKDKGIEHLYKVPIKNRNGEIVGEVKPCL